MIPLPTPTSKGDRNVPSPTDLLKAWQDAIGEVGSAAASLVSGPAEAAGDLLSPFQRQAEQLQSVLQKQLEFEREMLGRAAAPARAALEIFEQTTTALRAQAKAFRAAATSFEQVAQIMEQEAGLMEQAARTIKDPVAALRAAGDAVRGENAGEKKKKK
jgi:ABC-type transporter Mla subunit MlaD